MKRMQRRLKYSKKQPKVQENINKRFFIDRAIGLIVLIWLLLLSSACTNESAGKMLQNKTPVPTIEATAEPTPTLKPTTTPEPTPEPTPTPTPVPSPTPEFLREEELEALGVVDPDQIWNVCHIWSLVYSINGHNKILPVRCIYDTRVQGFYFASFWDNTNLFFFDMKDDNRSINFILHLDVCSVANPAIDGASIVRFFALFQWKTEADYYGIPIGDSEYSELVDKTWSEEDKALSEEEVLMTKLEIANWYLDVVPSEFRVMTADLHPTVPTPSPEPTVTPEPGLSLEE